MQSALIDRPPSLEDAFAGQLVRPGDDRFDELRRVFNGAIDRRPALIARCTGAADVIAAVNYARREGRLVSIYGGGHSFAGHAVCDDGLMIDLRPMKGVRVDPVRRVVHAQAGCTWGELDRETQAFGLAVTGGRMSTTGIAGYTLGGGSGYLERKLGRACDNLLSVDMVTADGRFQTVSEHAQPELFWGMRGAGSNFGVVISFELALHPIGPLLYGGLLLYPHERAREVLRFYREFMAEAPDEVGGSWALFTAPPAEPFPEAVRGRPVLGIILCHVGAVADGERTLAPMRDFTPPTAQMIGTLPYTVIQRQTDFANPHGILTYSTGSFLGDLDDDAIDTLLTHTAQPSSPLSIVAAPPGGGAVARVSEDAMASGQRAAAWNLHIAAKWTHPAETDGHVAWARGLAEAIAPHGTGSAFLNFVGEGGRDRVAAAFGPAKYERLMALKNRYDPDNLFRVNHNIAPSGR